MLNNVRLDNNEYSSISRADKRNTVCCFEGKQFNSLSEAAAYYNIDPFTFRYRVRNKWPEEEIIGKKKKIITRNTSGTIFKGIGITVEGKKYPSIAAAARHYGLKKALVTKRLNNKLSINQAFGLEVIDPAFKGANHSVEVEGIVYPSLLNVCDVYNATYSKVSYRYNNGWTIEEALGLVEKHKTKKKKGKLTLSFPREISGIKFKNLAQACKHFNINRSTVNKRVSKGMSLIEALQK